MRSRSSANSPAARLDANASVASPWNASVASLWNASVASLWNASVTAHCRSAVCTCSQGCNQRFHPNANGVAPTTIEQFAVELGMPVTALLEHLAKAGVIGKKQSDSLSDLDKARLLDCLRRQHGAAEHGSCNRLHCRESRDT